MSEGSIFPLDLREQRKRAGLTQAELAEKIGTVGIHVHRIETGKKGLSFQLALECARIFGTIKVRYNGQVFILRPDGSMSPDDDPGGGRPQPILNNVQCSDEGVALAAEREMEEAVETLRRLRQHVNAFSAGQAIEYVQELGEQVLEDVRCVIDLLEFRLKRRPNYAAALAEARRRQRLKLTERGYRREDVAAA